MGAHFDAVIFRLARLYDQHSAGLGLKRFLLTVKDSLKYFSESAVTQRLPRFAGSTVRKVNASTLANDIRRVCADRDQLVARVWKLRNESVSHTNANPVRLGVVPSGLKPNEIATLLRRARNIVTRYSLIYRASCVFGKIVGADDYLNLLDLVRRGRMSLVAAREAEMRSFMALKKAAQRNLAPKQLSTQKS